MGRGCSHASSGPLLIKTNVRSCPIADIDRLNLDVRLVPIADMANCHHLRLHLGTYRTLHFRECLFARVFVTSAVGGARTQHGLSDSRNRFSRHLAKFFLGSSD